MPRAAWPTRRVDVWPSWSPEGWRLFDSPCESKSRTWWFGPALCLRQKAATPRFSGPHHRHPDRRAEGPEWRDPFEQSFHKAPDALPQLHQRNRCAMLKNGFLDPRCCALLRTASLGMTMMGPPRLQRAGWHAHARVGMSWQYGALVVPWPHKCGHATRPMPHDHEQDEQQARAGQATENHRDHRTDLRPGCLCALGVLCGKPHGPRDMAHPTIVQAPLAVIPTAKARVEGSTHGAREAVCSGVVTPGGNSMIRMFLKWISAPSDSRQR